jgi:hypothetical protein
MSSFVAGALALAFEYRLPESVGCEREDLVRISARVQNSCGQHQIKLTTDDQAHSIHISPKATGLGSSANGGGET